MLSAIHTPEGGNSDEALNDMLNMRHGKVNIDKSEEQLKDPYIRFCLKNDDDLE